MRSTIAIPNTPRSGPGKSLTLVGYSSVLPKDHWSQAIYIRFLISLTTIGRPWIELRISMISLWGQYKGSVVEWCCYSALCVDECTLFHILHQNRAQNIIQCHDNNIWKQTCIFWRYIYISPASTHSDDQQHHSTTILIYHLHTENIERWGYIRSWPIVVRYIVTLI